MNLTARVKTIGCIAAVIAAIQTLSSAENEASTKEAVTVVSQKTINSTACGACSLYNMLANGRPEFKKIASTLPGGTPENRVRHILQKYGGSSSTVYPNRARYSEKTGGIAAEDMKAVVNDCLKEFAQKPLVDDFLDRKEGEASRQHLTRVHALLQNSLKAGVPPIINVRAFVAIKETTGDGFHWDGLAGHLVALVDIEPELRESDKGFRFWYAESDNGREQGSIESAYICVEEARTFTAPRKFYVLPDGTEKFDWVPNSAFLVVTAPSLRLKTQEEANYKRTIFTLRHAVYAER